MLPTVPGTENILEDIPEDSAADLDGNGHNKPGSISFSRQASRNSGGLNFWDRMDKDFRTPPPTFPPRGSSSLSGDLNMDSPDGPARAGSISLSLETYNLDESGAPQSSAAVPARKFGKRSRDDDFDVMSIKRRAVSPSLSITNSPTVAQSPGHRESISWGQPPKTARESSIVGNSEPIRSNSGGSVSSMTSSAPAAIPKRVGLQGMTDTHDGLMKMSIE